MHVWLFGHVKKPPTQKSKGCLFTTEACCCS
nr:MAG TPA: hypothetical protein [Caudoviricetes sp.]